MSIDLAPYSTPEMIATVVRSAMGGTLAGIFGSAEPIFGNVLSYRIRLAGGCGAFRVRRSGAGLWTVARGHFEGIDHSLEEAAHLLLEAERRDAANRSPISSGWRRVVGDERFNVVQFFADETHEYIRRRVSAEEAVKTAHAYYHSVGAQIGTTRRVIITDDGDCTNFEWRYGEGVVFPSRAERVS